MGRIYRPNRVRSPQLPFEMPATMPTTHPVAALYKDLAHTLSIQSGLYSNLLPVGQTDAAGGRYNVVSAHPYKWYDEYSDPSKTGTRGDHGGRPQGRPYFPGYPRRGVLASNTEWGAGGWRQFDTATELGWAKDAGINLLFCEATGQTATDGQVKLYTEMPAAAARVGGIQIALQFDSVAMGNNYYDATNYANITAAAIGHAQGFVYDGVRYVGAFSPAQLTNGPSSNVDDISGSNAWLNTFFSRLAALGLSDVALAPLYSGWSNTEYDGFEGQMSRVSGKTSWAGRVDINNPETAEVQATHATYIRAHGGHNVAWAIRPQALYPHNGFYYEPGGWATLKAQYDTAIANKVSGDMLYAFTWNDLLEGAEICPGDRTQWAILDVCAYYNVWWRTGSAPTIVRDCLYYMHRLHAYDASPDVTYQTINKQLMLSGHRFYNSTQSTYPSRNIVSVMAFLTAPADVTVTTSEGTWLFEDVPAGVTLLDELTATGKASAGVPLPVTLGGTPRFTATRAGQSVADVTSAFPVHAGTTVPYWQDLQYGCGGSLRSDLGLRGYTHPYIEPVLPVRNFTKGKVRYG